MNKILNIAKGFVPQSLKLIETKKEAQNAHTLVFSKPSTDFQAGQHYAFILNHNNTDRRGSMRIFSLTSAPYEEHIAITTRYFKSQSSSFKKALLAMKPGDHIKVLGPSIIMDTFKIHDYNKPQVFIVGGIGVTPLYSVLKQTLHEQQDIDIQVFYANKDSDFIFGKEMQAIAKKLPNLSIHKTTSPRRFTTSQLQQAVTHDSEIAISGTPEFVGYYASILKKDLQIRSKQIKSYKQKSIVGKGYK